MTIGDKDRITDIMDKYVIESKKVSELELKNFARLLMMYTDTFKGNSHLHKFLLKDQVYNHYKEDFYVLTYYMDYLTLILNYDGKKMFNNDQLLRLYISSYIVTDNFSIEDYYSDFDVFNLIIELIKETDFFNPSKKDIYEIKEYAIAFVFSLYKNLSLVLGHKFDINNYNYQEIRNTLVKLYNSFVNSEENIKNMNNHLYLNNGGGEIAASKAFTSGLFYADSYLKRFNAKRQIL